jgi:hypothetical protein
MTTEIGLSSLTELGFTEDQARVALQMASGNVQRAVHFLLENAQAAAAVSAGPTKRQPAAPAPRAPAPAASGDRALEAALDASRREAAAETKRRAEARQAEQAVTAASAPAAARRHPFSILRGGSASAAAAAAERRLAGQSGGVPRPPPPAPHSRGGGAAAAAATARFAMPAASTAEQKVQSCAARLSSHAVAVDTLLVSLERAIASPNDERCRKVSLSNPTFHTRVGSVPGGVEFLMAVGYQPMHDHLVLQHRDPALLWVGKAALQEAQRSLAYMHSKEAAQLKAALSLSSSEYAAEEARRRASFLARVPEEPPEGAAGTALLCLHVGDAQHWRRFESCCTLEDALNFARSLPGTPLGSALTLCNVTLRPAVRLDASTQRGLTLQRLDLWPTGHLRVELDA